MNIPRRLSSLALLSAVAAGACPAAAAAMADPPVAVPAQPGGPTTKPAPAPANPPPSPVAQPPADAPAVAEGNDPDGRGRVLPEVAFNGVAVDDVIAFLQDVNPKFKAVVVRRGVREGPTLSMRLKDVSVGQVLDVMVTAYPGVEIQAVDGPTGPVHVVTISRPDPAAVGEAAGDAGGADEDGPGVRVYRLTGVIEQLVRNKGWTVRADDAKTAEAAAAARAKLSTEALNDVLSLVKAAIQFTGGRQRPTLQVHEETQTLIFQGNARQRAALEDVLAALETNQAVRPPTPNEGADRERREAAAALRRARADVEAVKVEADRKVSRLEEELQKMNAQLRESQAAANEAKAAADRANAAAKAAEEEAKAKLDAARRREPRGDAGPKPSGAAAAVKEVDDGRLVLQALRSKLGTRHPSVLSRMEALKAATDRAAAEVAAESGEDGDAARELRRQAVALEQELRPTAEAAEVLRARVRDQALADVANLRAVEQELWEYEASRPPADDPKLQSLRRDVERRRSLAVKFAAERRREEQQREAPEPAQD